MMKMYGVLQLSLYMFESLTHKVITRVLVYLVHSQIVLIRLN